MEDKHIYSTSLWSKLQDRFSGFIKEVQNIIRSLKPKRKQTSSTIFTETIQKEVPQTPITTAPQQNERAEKPKVKKHKKERIKKFHYRKIADEFTQKILVAVLSTLIIAIFGMGVFLSYKDVLYPQRAQNTPNKPQGKSTSPTSDTTASWNTYTNSVFKFEFKIPKDFSIYEGSNYSLAIIKKQQKEITAPHEIESDIQIWINANRDGEYGNYNDTISNRTKSDRHPSKLQIIETDKYIFFTGWWPGPFSEGNYYATEAIIKYGNGAISFKQQHKPNENTLLMEQILSTFKFLD